MSPQQHSISLALEQLRRSTWPDVPAEFEATRGDASVPPQAATLDDRLASLNVKAHRWTCEARADEIRAALQDKSRLVLLHAIDADPAIPLLATWARCHLSLLLGLVESLSGRCKLVLPADWPQSRRELKRTDVHWVEPKYPSGHWRILPHVLGFARQRPIVLDSVAAVDLALHLASRDPTPQPIAICDTDRSDPVRFTLAGHAERLGEVLSFDEQTRWIAGPRWRRWEVSADDTVDDGEIVFHAYRERPSPQSPCIRCGWCEHICPTQCSPAEFVRAYHPHDAVRARRAGLGSCIDCGLCTNVCPSNLPLQRFIDDLKRQPEGNS